MAETMTLTWERDGEIVEKLRVKGGTGTAADRLEAVSMWMKEKVSERSGVPTASLQAFVSSLGSPPAASA